MMSLFSCSKEAPEATNEILDKGHEQWYKVVFRFTEGEEITQNGTKYFETIRVSESENPSFPIAQEYVFEYTKDGVITRNDRPISLVKGKSYSLEILYYNKKNQLMNNEFTTPEMAPIHQHFFIPESIKSIKEGIEKGKKEEIITYNYRDTNPYDKMLNEDGVTLRKWNEPLGLKGYFITNNSYQSFDLKVVLVHVIKGTKLDDSGKPYPFHSPSSRILGTTDLSVKIPMKVFTSSDSPSYKSDVSKEFHIPLEDVKKEISEREKLFEDSPKIKF